MNAFAKNPTAICHNFEWFIYRTTRLLFVEIANMEFNKATSSAT